MQRNFLTHLKKTEYTGRFLYNKSKKDIDLDAKKIITQLELTTKEEINVVCFEKKERKYYRQIIKLAALGSKAAVNFLKKPDYYLQGEVAFDLIVDSYLSLGLKYRDADILSKLFKLHTQFQLNPRDLDLGMIEPNFDKAIDYLERAAAIDSVEATFPAYRLVLLYACELNRIMPWKRLEEIGYLTGFFKDFLNSAIPLVDNKKLSTAKYIEMIARYANQGSVGAITYLRSMYRKGIPEWGISSDEQQYTYWKEKKKENEKLLVKRCLHYLDNALACSMKYGKLIVYKKNNVTISIIDLIKIYFSLTGMGEADKPAYIASFIDECKRYAKEGYAASYLVLASVCDGNQELGIQPNVDLHVDYLKQAINLHHFPVSGQAAYFMYNIIKSSKTIPKEKKDELLQFAARLGSPDAVIKIIKSAIDKHFIEVADQWLEFAHEYACYFNNEYYFMAERLITLIDRMDQSTLDQYYIKWHARSMLKGSITCASILTNIARSVGLETLADEGAVLYQEMREVTHKELYKDKVDAFANKLIAVVCNTNQISQKVEL